MSLSNNYNNIVIKNVNIAIISWLIVRGKRRSAFKNVRKRLEGSAYVYKTKTLRSSQRLAKIAF